MPIKPCPYLGWLAYFQRITERKRDLCYRCADWDAIKSNTRKKLFCLCSVASSRSLDVLCCILSRLRRVRPISGGRRLGPSLKVESFLATEIWWKVGSSKDIISPKSVSSLYSSLFSTVVINLWWFIIILSAAHCWLFKEASLISGTFLWDKFSPVQDPPPCLPISRELLPFHQNWSHYWNSPGPDSTIWGDWLLGS